MKPSDREKWLLEEMKSAHCGIDILDSAFVDRYIEATGAAYRPTCFGANKCEQLGRDLARLAKLGKATRFRCGLAGAWQPGFPTWVWSYELPETAMRPNV